MLYWGKVPSGCYLPEKIGHILKNKKSEKKDQRKKYIPQPIMQTSQRVFETDKNYETGRSTKSTTSVCGWVNVHFWKFVDAYLYLSECALINYFNWKTGWDNSADCSSFLWEWVWGYGYHQTARKHF